MVNITEPTDNDIIAWWNWAARFSIPSSPFERGWGGAGVDRNNSNQTAVVFCLSCTAGNGGRDNVPRPLQTAKESGKDILVPVFVSFGGTLAVARSLLGRVRGGQSSPAIEFFVDGDPVNYFYKETNVGNVTFVNANSFQEPPGNTNVVSAGFWANVSSDVTSIEFGGNGGQRNPANPARFDTGVSYS